MRWWFDEQRSFWFLASFRLRYRVFKPAPSPKPRQKPKILAARRYIFSVNVLGLDGISPHLPSLELRRGEEENMGRRSSARPTGGNDEYWAAQQRRPTVGKGCRRDAGAPRPITPRPLLRRPNPCGVGTCS